MITSAFDDSSFPGTTHLLLEPLELLEKLAALTPRPAAHLLLYHGVLAPHAAWRQRVVAFARPPGDAAAAAPSNQPAAAGRPRYRAWAVLIHRAFGLDGLACPRCGGRLRLIATISDLAVVAQILAHLGLTPVHRPPGPPPPSSPSRHAPRGAALPLCLRPAALDAAQGLDQNHRTNDRAPDGSPASAPRVLCTAGSMFPIRSARPPWPPPGRRY